MIVTEDGTMLQLSVRKHRRRFGSAKGMIWMSDDFDAPLEDFEPYTR
ncbi:MAG: DUF2281 domain-containing protein [Anaerolineae bacterium]|nr:DUF2281 domain-containing protein [Anaerolineae bacterium]